MIFDLDLIYYLHKLTVDAPSNELEKWIRLEYPTSWTNILHKE